jgi:hypothetical protein
VSDAPGTESCGCCAGRAHRTPVEVTNRPGLPEIARRVGTHGDFLASMVAGLSGAAHPALSALRTRDSEDPTIALLDAWAVTCDVLTFYTERLANEAFLRTAVERTSLAGLGALVAYRLRPGAAAETHLAFTIERPPAVPAALGPDPGLLPPVTPSSVTLPVGLRVQSIPGPGEQPQTFETVEQIEARPEWNALTAARTRFYPPVFGRRDAWLSGLGLNLRRGDALLLASKDLVNDRWDVRLLTEVTEDPADGRTHVRWDRGLGSFTPPNSPAEAPDAYVLRKRFSVFGHQAPVWRAMNADFRTGYQKVYGGTVDQNEWQGFTAAAPASGTGADAVTSVDLDGSHPDVAVGSWVVLSQETGTFYRELYEVKGVAELSRSEFGVSGTVTRLTLRGEGHAWGTPRQVSVLAVADPLTLIEAPDTGLVTGGSVVVDGDATGLAPKRTVVLTGTTPDGASAAEVLTVASAAPAPGGRTTVTFATAATGTYVRATAALLGNVVKATHGETVQQVGDGDARRAFQEFALRNGPLTHVQADTPTGVASTLTVRVDDVAWTERTALYGAGPSDRAFVTRDLPDGSTAFAFGDGRTGARLPSGTHNVRATYRKGLGAAGNVAAGAVALPMDRPLGLKAASNPTPATGGVDPEDAAAARRSIPLPVRTLGRAVSLRDYADFALAFTGIALASAAVLTLRQGRTVVVTVAGPGAGPAAPSTIEYLGKALREQGDPNVRVLVLPYRQADFRVALKVRVASDREPTAVLTAVEAALRSAYGRAARDLGQAVRRSAVVATCAGVPGVTAVDLDRLYRTSSPSLKDTLVAAPASATSAGTALGGELLALSDDPLDWLQQMPGSDA